MNVFVSFVLMQYQIGLNFGSSFGFNATFFNMIAGESLIQTSNLN